MGAFPDRFFGIALHQSEAFEALGDRPAGQEVDVQMLDPGRRAATAA
jgi:hypothetical protein